MAQVINREKQREQDNKEEYFEGQTLFCALRQKARPVPRPLEKPVVHLLIECGLTLQFA